jgi:nitroreductase
MSVNTLTVDKIKILEDILHHRRSIRVFDPAIPMPEEVVKRGVAHATLAPNSSNLQLWEFHHIHSEAMKEQFGPLCLGQKAGSTAQSLLVVVVRRDLWGKRQRAILASFEGQQMPEKQRKLIQNYYGRLIPMLYSHHLLGISTLLKKLLVTVVGWFKPIAREVGWQDMRIVAHKSAALAAENFMLSIAASGYDSCPMEGMDSYRIKKLLGLPYSAEISMVIGLGKRLPEGVYGERWRVPMEEVYKLR